MTEITISIIQKVKEELSVSDDLASTELYDLLHKYRNSQHPDKFVNDERKKVAEEKFKKLNTLLLELANFIEQEKQQKKPSEIIPFQKDYEIVKTKQQSIEYEEIIKNLKLKIEVNEINIKEFKKEILKLRSEKVDEKTIELIKLYKPTKRNLYSLGISFLLTLIAGVLIRIDNIAQIINKYSPLDQKVFNYIIFFILIFIPLRYLKMLFEESQIDKVSKRIKTPLFISNFVKYLDNKEVKDSFMEMDVYDYLYTSLFPRNIVSKLFLSKIFNLYNETTIDSLKDIFIYNLINRQLISISSANKLDRRFKIINTTYYSSVNFDLDDIPF